VTYSGKVITSRKRARQTLLLQVTLWSNIWRIDYSHDLKWPSRLVVYCESFQMRICVQLCSSWQDFNRVRALRGPSATAEPLVTCAVGSSWGSVFSIVCLSVYPHNISKTDVALITKLDKMTSPGNPFPFILGLKCQKSRSRVTKPQPASIFALLWVLVFLV